MTDPQPGPPGTGLTQPEEARNLLAPSAGVTPPDSTGLSPDEEAQLIALQRKATDARQGAVVDLRITSNHSGVTYGGHVVTREWTPTPAWLVPAFASAAADAGVDIEQREES